MGISYKFRPRPSISILISEWKTHNYSGLKLSIALGPVHLRAHRVQTSVPTGLRTLQNKRSYSCLGRHTSKSFSRGAEAQSHRHSGPVPSVPIPQQFRATSTPPFRDRHRRGTELGEFQKHFPPPFRKCRERFPISLARPCVANFLFSPLEMKRKVVSLCLSGFPAWAADLSASGDSCSEPSCPSLEPTAHPSAPRSMSRRAATKVSALSGFGLE